MISSGTRVGVGSANTDVSFCVETAVVSLKFFDNL